MENDETDMLDRELETANEGKAEKTPEEASEGETELDNEQSDELEADEETEGDEEEVDTEEADEKSGESEFAEIEIDGQTYKVPEAIKDGYLRQADFTRKSQENAETRRQLEAKAQQVDQLTQTTQEELQIQAQLMGVQAQFESLQQQWEATADDPLARQDLLHTERDLERAATQLSQQLQHAQTQRSEQARQLDAQRLRETEEHAKSKIPGWTPEVHGKIEQFAQEKFGQDRATLSKMYTPQFYEGLYLAWIGQQALDKQKAAPKTSKSKAPKQPLSKVNSKGNPTGRKSLEDMSTEEYVAHMNKREKARNARAR